MKTEQNSSPWKKPKKKKHEETEGNLEKMRKNREKTRKIVEEAQTNKKIIVGKIRCVCWDAWLKCNFCVIFLKFLKFVTLIPTRGRY